MAVDVEEGGEAIVVDYVGGPDFVVEGWGGGGESCGGCGFVDGGGGANGGGGGWEGGCAGEEAECSHGAADKSHDWLFVVYDGLRIAN